MKSVSSSHNSSLTITSFILTVPFVTFDVVYIPFNCNLCFLRQHKSNVAIQYQPLRQFFAFLQISFTFLVVWYHPLFLLNHTNTFNSILEAKETFLRNQGTKLSTPETSQKTYWNILKHFLNKCKVPRIPPLFHDNSFITNCKLKAG